MANPLHPDLMTDEERLDESARILSAGFLRGTSRKGNSKTKIKENVFLDKHEDMSVHGHGKNQQGENLCR